MRRFTGMSDAVLPCRSSSVIHKSQHLALAMPLAMSRGRQCGQIRAACRRHLRSAGGHGLLPMQVHRSYRRYHAASRRQLFPSPSGLGRDRRDADRRSARAATAQYAKVSPVEHVYPLVRTQKQLDRVLAEIEESPGIVLYTLLDDELLAAAGEALPRARPAVPVDPRAGAAAVAVLSRRRDRRTGSARSTCSTPNISSASTRSTTPCCMTTASISKTWRRPTSCWSACRARRRRRPRSISPIAA